jgi:hypothetical protein
VADLANDEVSLNLALASHLLERLEALALEGSVNRDDGVAHGL